MFNELIDKCKNPINSLVYVFGFIVAAYGLWINSWSIIIVSIAILVAGYLFSYGKKLSFNDLIDRHKNPTNGLLHILGFAVAIYGIWQHDWNVIIFAVIILIVGHLFPYKKEQIEEPKKSKKSK